MNATNPGKRNAKTPNQFARNVAIARAEYVRALVQSVMGAPNYTSPVVALATSPSARVAATPGKLGFSVAAVRAMVGIDAIRSIGLK